MQLTIKQYTRIKIGTVIILAVAFSQSLIFKNFFIPIALLAIASLVLLFFRKQIKEVIADERDYATAGKAASLAIQIYSWMAVVLMFLFYSLSAINPAYNAIAMTLAFSITILMLLNVVIFRYYNKFKFSDRRVIFGVLVLIFFIFLAIFSLRLFSGEDNWVCKNGNWVKHGNPSFNAPTAECK